MHTHLHGLALGALLAVLAPLAENTDGEGQSRTQGMEVTLRGSLVCNGACIPDPKEGDHGLVLFALEGTPEIHAEVDRIMKDYYPARGLDAEAAQKLMDRLGARLKFYLAPDSPALKGAASRVKNHYCMPAQASAVTGVLTDEDGKKWIRATRIQPAQLRFPDRMLAADRPFVRPAQAPLTLKIGARLTLQCVYIPPGQFLMGTPVYMWPYFVEEYPHQVTLTRPFYLAEIPITQQMFEAVLGYNPSTIKDPDLPVQNPRFADIDRFCRMVAKQNGRKVRLPTDAEWEYAARVGTSNPGFEEKYRDQNSTGPNGFQAPLRVKSRAANAWGLYDMASCWWEISADRGMYNVRRKTVDPSYPPEADNPRSQRSGRGILKTGWSIGTHEFIREKPDYAGQKFRVLVEVDAAAPALPPN
jgi:formylglycine-generating enzyme required for sulfatase activity